MELSEERKLSQKAGDTPEWFTTAGYQMFKERYLHQPTIKKQYELIAITAASVLPEVHRDAAEVMFFQLLWNGWISPSTPILCNMGTDRGLPVSCSGGYVDDSIAGFYESRLETAVLTKHGFGTSSYLGDVRYRGSRCKTGTASGVMPLIDGFVRDMEEVAQGAARRGAWAGYLPIQHGDFDEVADSLLSHPDGKNIGWVVNDSFIRELEDSNHDDHYEALRRYRKALMIKMTTGKGYFFFVDKANRHRPKMYSDRGLDIKATNLCTEIMLHSSEEYTYTCILASMNVAKWNEWKHTQAVYWATIFLDCVASDFINRAGGIPHLEKAVEFTKKGRAIGLGQCGLHTLFQQEGLPYESLQAQFLSTEIAKHIWEESERASKELAYRFGEPEWCKGTGLRNTHRIAIAPTKSTSLIMGGISEGINPDPALVFSQRTAAGEFTRISPVFLDYLKRSGNYTPEKIAEVSSNFGSVQKVDWMEDKHKEIFRTAFEIDQSVHLRYASQRQHYVDQGQSINLFFDGRSDAKYISDIHRQAFLDENILSLYYIQSLAGVSASKGLDECLACQ